MYTVCPGVYDPNHLLSYCSYDTSGAVEQIDSEAEFQPETPHTETIRLGFPREPTLVVPPPDFQSSTRRKAPVLSW